MPGRSDFTIFFESRLEEDGLLFSTPSIPSDSIWAKITVPIDGPLCLLTNWNAHLRCETTNRITQPESVIIWNVIHWPHPCLHELEFKILQKTTTTTSQLYIFSFIYFQYLPIPYDIRLLCLADRPRLEILSGTGHSAHGVYQLRHSAGLRHLSNSNHKASYQF